MATVKAFRAIRPADNMAKEIAALPYDVYSSSEARVVVESHPHSFLKIDRAETQLPLGTDIYSDEVYQCASRTLQNMIKDGEFIREEKPCLYLYELTMNGRSQTGFGACVSVAEYENQTIKKHENTRQDKEEDRVRHVEACSAQTGPIFLAYRFQDALKKIQDEVKSGAPIYDFCSEDGISHRLWVIADEKMITRIQNEFAKVDTLYIADGHHRAASAVRVAQKKRGLEGANQEAEYFLSVIFADEELLVMDYNRYVKDLNGYTVDSFLAQLEKTYEIATLEGAEHPKKKGSVTMYLDYKWYELTGKKSFLTDDVVENLDVSILQREVLDPLLGIQNPKTDQRIQFVGGIRGLGELEGLVDANGGVAFAMYPTSMEELFAVADAGRLMPPKSTWFEPKLRSGLLIHEV